MPLSNLAGAPLSIEEKVDGGNCGIYFSAGGELRLQSREPFLTGG